VSSGQGRIADERFARQIIQRDHESSDRSEPQCQSGRGQYLIDEADERRGRSLLGRLVEQPPEDQKGGAGASVDPVTFPRWSEAVNDLCGVG
jgi:hypothetical protein